MARGVTANSINSAVLGLGGMEEDGDALDVGLTLGASKDENADSIPGSFAEQVERSLVQQMGLMELEERELP